MAVLAISAAGAAVGGFFGGPMGASVGWMVGGLVGNFLFPTKGPHTEGPRLGDLSVTSSAYGAPIAIVEGTARVGGNIIWALPIREERKEERVGGKGGLTGGGATASSSSYYGNFAVALSEGVASKATRVWGDGKIIYDTTGSGLESTFLDQGVSLSGNINTRQFGFRFYPGSYEQLPDPLISAHVGADDTPAYRGTCYIVFENMPLEDFGNRIPNITAEVSFNTDDDQVRLVMEKLDTSADSGFLINSPTPDWDRELFYAWESNRLRIFNLRTMAEERSGLVVVPDDMNRASDPLSDPGDRLPPGIGDSTIILPDGRLVTSYGSANVTPLVLVDPNNYNVVAAYGAVRTGTHDVSGFITMYDGIAWSCSFGVENLIFVMGFNNQFGLATATRVPPPPGGSFTAGTIDGSIRNINAFIGAGFDVTYSVHCCWCPGHIDPSGEAYIWGVGNVTGNLYRLWITPSITAGIDPSLGWQQLTMAEPLFDVAGGTVRASIMWWDPVDFGIIVLLSNGRMIKWIEGVGITWDHSGRPVPGTIHRNHNKGLLGGQRLAYAAGSTVVTIDTTTGEMVEYPGWFGAGDGAQFFHAPSMSLYVHGAGSGSTGTRQDRWLLERVTVDGVPLAGVVERICARVGLEATDIDTTELVSTVRGYVIGRQTTARSALEPLLGAFFFDAVETDFTLTFLNRGRDSEGSIPQSDLASLNDDTGQVVEEVRIQELELPREIHVQYMNLDNDYQIGVGTSRRPRRPLPVMHSEQPVTLDMPIAMHGDEALSIAERRLYAAWAERSKHGFRAGWKYLAVNPTDVWDLTLADGTVLPTRVGVMEVGADLTINFQGDSADGAHYVDSGRTAEESNALVSVAPANSKTKLLIVNVPLLRDLDDIGRVRSRQYYWLAGVGQAGWRGATLFESMDGATWTELGSGTNEAQYGRTTDRLGDTDSPWTFDDVNTVTVRMTNFEAELESFSDDQLLAGSGAYLVGDEIIQAGTATQNGDDTWTLSHLLRGRRGTEWACASHTSGEVLIELALETANIFEKALEEVGQQRMYKAVGQGLILEGVSPVNFTPEAYDLKPYAPTGLVSEESAGDWILSWIRRTRVGGSWLDGADVALSEDSEEYEVDVEDFAGTIHTIDSLTVPTTTIDAADVTTWFPDDPVLTVLNAGFEEGDLSSWVQINGNGAVTDAVSPGPNTGTYYWATFGFSATEIYQNISVPSYKWEGIDLNEGDIDAELTWYLQTASPDTGAGYLEFYDEDGSIIGSRETSTSVAEASWTAKSLTVAIPPLTRSIRIGFVATLVTPEVAVYVDDVGLSILDGSPTMTRLDYIVHQISEQVGRGFGADSRIAKYREP